MTAPDLPLPRDPFTVDHLARWPMGTERAELDDGELVWAGDFDERDAVIARRTFPGRRVRIEPGAGLIVGPMAEDHEGPRRWVDAGGTEWDAFGGMVLRRHPGEQHWTLEPSTQEKRRRNREQLAAYRAEEWGAIVGEYSAAPRDVLAAWRYLQAHPIFWSWALPGDLADIDPVAIDETQWARIEAESWLEHSFGLAHLSVEMIRSPGPATSGPAGHLTEVLLEHGPVLWPLDIPAGHRTGFQVGGTPSHDPRLDVAEPTWEAAIVALAARVRGIYGDDRARVADPLLGTERE